jgi:hypothetical protein
MRNKKPAAAGFFIGIEAAISQRPSGAAGLAFRAYFLRGV